MSDSQRQTPEYPQAKTFEELLGSWRKDAEAAYEAEQSGIPRGAVTGLPRLDKELGGALPPGLHVLHGSAGAGKTALALQIAAMCGTGALYVSCEMSTLELFRRTAARVTETYLERFKTGELHPDKSVSLAMQTAEAVPALVIADASGGARADADWIEQQVQNLVAKSPRPPLVVIDSVHSWTGTLKAEGMQEYDALNVALAFLRQMAQRSSIPVIAIAERNRQSTEQGGLSASAGTRSFEYGAETVISLDRVLGADKKPQEPDMNGEVRIDLRLSKNRNGAAGKRINVLFSGRLQRFREVPK